MCDDPNCNRHPVVHMISGKFLDELQAACGLALEHGRLLEEAADLWLMGHDCKFGISAESDSGRCKGCWNRNPYRSQP